MGACYFCLLAATALDDHWGLSPPAVMAEPSRRPLRAAAAPEPRPGGNTRPGVLERSPARYFEIIF